MAALLRSYSRILQTTKVPSVARQMSGDAHSGSYKMWKSAFFFGCVPALALSFVNAFFMGDGSEHNRPEFVPYDHLRIRSKKFPWGDGNHSLFHNSHMNALPEGYEEGH